MKNKHARRKLAQIYGNGCFMERAGIREITPEQEKKMRKIKGYKKLDRRMSYHHIHEKSKGGRATVENGAILAAYNHEWLHMQTEEVKNDINQRLQDFKASIAVGEIQATDKGVEVRPDYVDLDFGDTISIPAYDTPKRNNAKRKNINRAKDKREFRKRVEEDLEL